MSGVFDEPNCRKRLSELTVAVVGLGLIGGSLTKCLREIKAVGRTVGFTLDPNHAKLGVELGVVDVADRVGNDLFLVEDRLPDVHVRRMGADIAGIGVVRHGDVAGAVVVDQLDRAAVV